MKRRPSGKLWMSAEDEAKLTNGWTLKLGSLGFATNDLGI